MTRGRLSTVAKLAVSAGLLGWLLHKAGLTRIGDALAHSELRRRWWRCLRLVFVGNTFNSILPSSIGGDVARAMMAADTPAERVPAATTVVLQRLCNFPGMMVLMGLG